MGDQNSYIENELNKRCTKLLGVSLEQIATMSNWGVQQILAPKLRKLAISQLRNPDSVIGKNFQAEYRSVASAMVHSSVKSFLKAQSSEGEWGTYVELTALGEALGFHVVVTSISEAESDTYPLYRASADHAPAIHIANYRNCHWFVDRTTQGNGNCLYNAVAQALQQQIPRSSSQMQVLSLDECVIATQKRQQALWQVQIQSLKRPEQIQAEMIAEQERIATLPEEEQKQIADDYVYALSLARHEYIVKGNPLSRVQKDSSQRLFRRAEPPRGRRRSAREYSHEIEMVELGPKGPVCA